MTTPDRPQAYADEGIAWLVDHAWPLWLDKGIDWQRRGFHEELDSDTLQCRATFRRLRVLTRQIYVFSQAVPFGISRADEAVALGLEFLASHARQSDGGYAWRFDLDGNVIDQTRDLYDHAFVLLAYSSASSVVGREKLRGPALDLISYILRNFRHEVGGFLESLPPALPRRQNPHMHLLEALLAAHRAFGDDVFLASASELIDLFLDRLLQKREGALPEFFDDKLTAERENGRFLVEPGHHFEWAWLLDWFIRESRDTPHGARNEEVAGALRSLFAFADLGGIHEGDHLAIDALWSDGSVQSPARRLWPQTERLKAETIRPDGAKRTVEAFEGMKSFWQDSRPGLWRERIAEDGDFIPEPVRASSFYHLTCGIVEFSKRPQ
ncbi:mannose-6-phosphate isomerase, type 3 [Faunimonas pinastri]|uniref:Mannose-6-phosphate isomerase, type 3 n=1 Tax=Faunimonas pinastri TaxID=1855383 RepID=A0A1H9PMC6_9HYPH|nr:AGE family epimerase/isomerase [Faunimonas pinastri]SER49344.1 mannose-6-phosphate isomerase, type 3 [Faunimonas pinastri]